ncbi:unnamed protein product [Mytilus coruscus]|uniref:Uncharacterized protein n=1 Tax=Mytilus coruscus TaxID=42192 RepID=A0A6J8BWW9_MYTCO|nr:unnamed protein product [Mytilus coruscus]
MLDKIHANVGNGKIKIIITIRDTVKHSCQEVFDSHRLFKYDFIDLSSDKFELSSEEKFTFLTKYMNEFRQSDYVEDAGFVDCNVVTILKTEEVLKIIAVNPVKGFPLAMYQFVHNDKFFHLGSKFFDRPTVAMLEEMNEIRRKGKKDTEFRIQYAVMVFTAINENCIDLDERSNRIVVRRIMRAIYGKTNTLKTCSISDAVAGLKGSYLVTFSNERLYRFHHPTLQECVILSFAQVDEEYIEQIIPFLSWSFFLKMVKSDAYTQKEGEIVLKIPPHSYKTLAYRLVEIYSVDFRSQIFDVYCFLDELVDTEVFQHKTKLLLTYFLQAFETEDSKDEQNENFSKTSEYIDKSLTQAYSRCDEHMKSKTFFLANFLVSIAIKERQFKVYDFILQKCNQILKTSNNFVAIDFMKAALIRSLYEICSTKDLSCVKATLNLVHKNKIDVVRDQGTNLTTVGLNTGFSDGSGYNYNDANCVFLTFCIWKAYAAMNEPVLRYLLSLYNEIPFDVNLFLKKIYCRSWLKELKSLSHKPLKWIIERFEDQEIVETDFLLGSTCQFQMFRTVEYLVSKCKTVDAISCIKMYLYEEGKNDDTECISNFYFNEDLFNFLFSKIDIDSTSSEMIDIVILTLQKPCIPDSVCETLLPVCIDNEDILTVASIKAHFYLTKLILENSHNVNVQSALLSACSKKTMNVLNALEIETEKLKIVNFIVLEYGTDQIDLKVVCQQALKCRLFKIFHWFIQKFDITLLDVHCIINFSLMCDESEILQNVMDTIDITGLDKLEVLRSVSEHYTVGCSTKILQIVSVIWDSTKNKAELKMKEILDMAYKKRCFELLKWIHENCNLHVSIDAKIVLMLACADGRIDVAKWILHSFEHASLDIEDLNLFMLACDDGRHRAFVQTLLDIKDGDLVMLVCNKVSHFKYQARKIDMIRWVIETFQIKPLDITLGVLTLIRHKKYNKLEIGDAFFKLGVSLLNKHFNCLSTEDKEELMTSFLHDKYYDVVNWLLEDKGYVPFDKQKVLNEACSDGQIKTIQLLKDYFHSLDMNEAMICACIGYTCDQLSICDYLWSEIDKRALDISIIVNTVCKKNVSDNVLTWILIKFQNYQTVNKVLISCCQEGKFNLLKHILITVDDEELDILSAPYGMFTTK